MVKLGKSTLLKVRVLGLLKCPPQRKLKQQRKHWTVLIAKDSPWKLTKLAHPGREREEVAHPGGGEEETLEDIRIITG
jgi:hypothetical protein